MSIIDLIKRGLYKEAEEKKKILDQLVSVEVDRLKNIIEYVTSKAKWQPTPDNTYCNQAAFEIIDLYGYDATAIMDKRKLGQYYTTAQEMCERADEQARLGNYIEVNEKTAQQLANRGILVLVCSKRKRAKSAHVAIVYPGTYDWIKGADIGQAGGKNGIMKRLEGFGKPGTAVEFPKFYILPKKE